MMMMIKKTGEGEEEEELHFFGPATKDLIRIHVAIPRDLFCIPIFLHEVHKQEVQPS